MSTFWRAWCLAAAISFGGVLSRASEPPPSPAIGGPVPAATPQPEKSPVDAFRELLAMSPGDRKAMLADRPPEVQQQVLAKIREYLAMRPAERDVRLEVTELYYYLWPLMKTPATNRPAQLLLVPEGQRPKVDARLREWDKLPAIKQQELLTNALAVRHYLEIQVQPPLPLLSPDREEKLERGIRNWQTLSEDRRRQITARFNEFFGLTDTEKQKTLKTLSEPERRQIQKTLDKFARLTPAEREDYLLCFNKFAQLSPAERQQFMKKAERWSALPSDERQEWREMVDSLTRLPPLPPGSQPPPPPDEE